MKRKYQSIIVMLTTVFVVTLLVSRMTTPTLSQASSNRPDTPLATPTECTAAWSAVSSPNPGTNNNVLYGTSAISSSNVWTVGYYETVSGTNTLVEHWDGASWSVIPSPSPGTYDNELRGVAAILPSDVWAVGNSMNHTLVEHWDGSNWNVVPSPNPGIGNNNLSAVAALSSNDVWAVGYYETLYGTNTLVEHWDGVSWSVILSPNPSTGGFLSGITTISSSAIWAVGYDAMRFSQTLIEYWNGTSWNTVPSPNVGSQANKLRGVTAISINDIWAVGDSTNDTLVEHWDGTSWSVVASPSPSTDGNELSSISAISPSDVWAVGDEGGGPNSTLAEHWGGASWSVIPSSNPSSNAFLDGVAAVSSHDVWAVGDYYSGSAFQTLVEHYSAAGCNTATPTPAITNTPIPTNTPAPTFTPQPTVCPNPFVDIYTNIFFHAINSLYCQGVINGTDSTHYTPGGTATRGQFAKLVALAFGLPLLTPQSGQSFTDVPPGYFAYVYIESGYHAGILNGFDAAGCAAHNAFYPCYLPNIAITRGQLTKLVVNAGGYALLTPASGPTFTDVPPTNVFYAFIETAAANHIISGYSNGTFRPNNNIRRDEMAQIVYAGQQNQPASPTPGNTPAPGQTSTPVATNTPSAPTDTPTPIPSPTSLAGVVR